LKKFTVFLFLSLNFIFAFKYTQGETLYFSKGCNGCHGVDAMGIQSYPKLAKKPQKYLIKKIKNYQKGLIKTQQANLMIPFAKSLNARELELISYFLENIYIENREMYYPDSDNWGDGGS
jgi:cytochrome c553